MTTIDEAKAEGPDTVTRAAMDIVFALRSAGFMMPLCPIGDAEQVALAHLRTLLAHTADYDALKGRLEEAPILSKYHGVRGFEVERFIADYEAWKAGNRAAFVNREKEAGR